MFCPFFSLVFNFIFNLIFFFFLYFRYNVFGFYEFQNQFYVLSSSLRFVAKLGCNPSLISFVVKQGHSCKIWDVRCWKIRYLNEYIHTAHIYTLLTPKVSAVIGKTRRSFDTEEVITYSASCNPFPRQLEGIKRQLFRSC